MLRQVVDTSQCAVLYSLPSLTSSATVFIGGGKNVAREQKVKHNCNTIHGRFG